MAITIPTRAQIITTIKAFFTVRFPARNLGTEGFLGKTWRAIAMAIWSFMRAVQDAGNDATPTSSTSTSGLNAWAEVLGLSNGDGGYGRKGATVATGGAVEATGTNGTIIADGTQAIGSDGVTNYETTGGPYTIALGVATCSMIATTAGTAGNLDTGEVLTWISPPAGLDASADVTTAFTGGTDQETNAAILARIQFRLRNPPKGGTASDYRYWCENATDTADTAIPIARAYVYPRRSGTGTVDTVVTIVGEGQSRNPGSTIVASVQTYLDTVRPVTVEASTVLEPYMPNSGGMVIRCRMVPSITAFAFDWDDTAAAYPTVKSYPTTSTIEINGAAPTALINAFAASTATTRPRIQIAGTGTNAPAKAQEFRVTAINQVPADDILTVDTTDGVILGTAVNGDVIYAGGPMVSTTQDDLIAYVDALGPSRASGFADPNDPWFSTASIAKLTQIALDAADTSGVAFSQNIVAGGVTIDGAAVDVTPTDTIADGPEILWASLVLVTQ